MTTPLPDDSLNGVTPSIVDLSAEPVTTLAPTYPAVFAATADWNRGGDLIVYSALPEPGAGAPDLSTVKPDGSGSQRRTFLTDEQGWAIEPTFDLDGTTVVFVVTP